MKRNKNSKIMGKINKTNNILITVGIPTYEAGESLITTLKAIYSQTIFKKFVKEVVLIVDGNKISRSILKKVKHPKLKIIYGEKRKGQSARINDIFTIAVTELIVLTNDDVVLGKKSLEKILHIYNKIAPDLITTDVKPLPQTTLLQKIIYTGHELTNNLSLSWAKGDNYLACNGRMICLSKRLYKNIKIPQKLWNNDAFIYIFSKINKYMVSHAYGATCYYLLPYTLKEHIRQSTKFKASFRENQKYFANSIKNFYIIPSHLIVANMIKIFLKNPPRLLAYLFIYLISNVSQNNKRVNKNSFWETDKSTKYIKGKSL